MDTNCIRWTRGVCFKDHRIRYSFCYLLPRKSGRRKGALLTCWLIIIFSSLLPVSNSVSVHLQEVDDIKSGGFFNVNRIWLITPRHSEKLLVHIVTRSSFRSSSPSPLATTRFNFPVVAGRLKSVCSWAVKRELRSELWTMECTSFFLSWNCLPRPRRRMTSW